MKCPDCGWDAPTLERLKGHMESVQCPASITRAHAQFAPKGPTGIEAVVCFDIAYRQEKGIAKYGVTVLNDPLTLRDWLQHAYEECLDQAVYLRRAIDQIDNQSHDT